MSGFNELHVFIANLILCLCKIYIIVLMAIVTKISKC